MVDAVSLEEMPPRSFPPSRRGAGSAARAVAPGGRDDLVDAHRYLCRRGARKFWRSGLERNDLEQVAALGLIKAARRYDAATRTPFEAYAWIMVVGELMHYVRDHERTVRVPRKLQTLERRFRDGREELTGRLGREPTEAELALELGVLTASLAELRRARAASLPVALEEAERYPAIDGSSLTPEDRVLVDEAFARLAPLERRIIVGLYILGLTQLELGRRLQLPAKRVSRLHRAALNRMHRAWLAGS